VKNCNFKEKTMDEIIQLKIKKEYAGALINHLQSENAIELISDEIENIPEWQKEAVRKTFIYAKENSETNKNWDAIKKEFDAIK
jgi:hypothetical protein